MVEPSGYLLMPMAASDALIQLVRRMPRLKRFRWGLRTLLDWLDQCWVVTDNVQSDVAIANTDPTLVRDGGSAVLGCIYSYDNERLKTENL